MSHARLPIEDYLSLTLITTAAYLYSIASTRVRCTHMVLREELPSSGAAPFTNGAAERRPTRSLSDEEAVASLTIPFPLSPSFLPFLRKHPLPT